MGINGDTVPGSSDRTNLSTYLVRQVLELISNEGLQPGDRIPSVRTLSERFGVASPTMRHALGRLQANGIVEIRHGSGIYVRNGWERVVIANPNRADINVDTVLHLLDARTLIEPHLAGLTALGTDEDKVAELERILDEAERYVGGDEDSKLHRANMTFHLSIAKFSGNPILAQTVESLLEIYSFEQLAIISFYDDRPRDHNEHLGLLQAIREQDSAHARELMHQHLSDVRGVFKERQCVRSRKKVARNAAEINGGQGSAGERGKE